MQDISHIRSQIRMVPLSWIHIECKYIVQDSNGGRRVVAWRKYLSFQGTARPQMVSVTVLPLSLVRVSLTDLGPGSLVGTLIVEEIWVRLKRISSSENLTMKDKSSSSSLDHTVDAYIALTMEGNASPPQCRREWTPRAATNSTFTLRLTVICLSWNSQRLLSSRETSVRGGGGGEHCHHVWF